MQDLKQYIEDNKQRFLDELFELIRIPSISSLEKHKPDMYKAAEMWKQILLDAGADVLVAGSFIFKSDNPTETIAELKAI